MKGFHSRTVSTSSVPCRFDLLSHIAGSFTDRTPVEGSHSPTFCSIIWEKLQRKTADNSMENKKQKRTLSSRSTTLVATKTVAV